MLGEKKTCQFSKKKKGNEESLGWDGMVRLVVDAGRLLTSPQSRAPNQGARLQHGRCSK